MEYFYAFLGLLLLFMSCSSSETKLKNKYAVTTG